MENSPYFCGWSVFHDNNDDENDRNDNNDNNDEDKDKDNHYDTMTQTMTVLVH